MCVCVCPRRRFIFVSPTSKADGGDGRSCWNVWKGGANRGREGSMHQKRLCGGRLLFLAREGGWRRQSTLNVQQTRCVYCCSAGRGWLARHGALTRWKRKEEVKSTSWHRLPPSLRQTSLQQRAPAPTSHERKQNGGFCCCCRDPLNTSRGPTPSSPRALTLTSHISRPHIRGPTSPVSASTNPNPDP